ncbi:MAG: hypothetical protein QOH96_855 [Blastocatellia bacterium]|nr:hypothetical protein [Blastocatellia bacterium]
MCVFCCAFAIVLSQPISNARGQGDSLVGRTITGTVFFLGGRGTGQSHPFTLIINRLTTSEEVQQLNAALQSGGQDALLKVLSKMQAGRIQLGTGVGVPANAIIATPQDGGTKLVVLYQRNLRFSEVRYGTRSENYKFGYAELYLGPKSNQGMLIPAAQIRLKDGNSWEVEDFGTFPARLMGLQVRGKGRPNVG